MNHRYAVMQELTPELVDNSAAPFRWAVKEPYRFPLETMADHEAPQGYVLAGREVRRVQQEDAETGRMFHVFQHVSWYDRIQGVPAPASPS